MGKVHFNISPVQLDQIGIWNYNNTIKPIIQGKKQVREEWCCERQFKTFKMRMHVFCM